MKHLYLIVSLLLTSFSVVGQHWRGEYESFVSDFLMIGKYTQGKFVMIDSIPLSPSGTFFHKIDSKKFTPSYYKIVPSAEFKKSGFNAHPHVSVSFFYDKDDLEYKTSWRNQSGYLKIGKGGNVFHKLTELFNDLSELQNITISYEDLLKKLPEKDLLISSLLNSYRDKITTFNLKCDDVAAELADNQMARLNVLVLKQYLPNDKWKGYKNYIDEKRKNYFKFIELQNPLLSNLPVLESIINSYCNNSEFINSSTQDELIKDVYLLSCKEIQNAFSLSNYKTSFEIAREKFLTLDYDNLASYNQKWFNEINNCLYAYTDESPYHDNFSNDVIVVFEKINKATVKEKFLNATFSIIEQYNWNSQYQILLNYLEKNKNNSAIRTILLSNNRLNNSLHLSKGLKAPEIKFEEKFYFNELLINDSKTIEWKELFNKKTKKIILLFYDTSCSHCENEIQELINSAPFFEKNSIKIVSIATGNETEYFEINKRINWKLNYLDLQGINSLNFKNYAIYANPTFFLIDEKSEILGKFISVNEIKRHILN